MKSPFVIQLSILLAGVILAATVYQTVREAPKTHMTTGNPTDVRPVNASDHILGNPSAQVLIVTWTDFDCPSCKAFHSAMRQILNDYGASRNIAWVVRNFPITELYPNSKKHAESAECVARAASNAIFWKYTDLLFDNQPAIPEKYAEFAKTAGADPEAVALCIQQATLNDIDTRIDSDRSNALDSGAQGTPYSLILISGYAPVVIDGSWPYEDLKKAIEIALAQVKK